MIMYGSTTFFILVQGAANPAHSLWTLGGAYDGQINLAGGMSTTGNLTAWFQDTLAEGKSCSEMFEVAAHRCPPGPTAC